MNSIPLLVFYVVLAIYLWFTFSIVYHFIRFGVGTTPKTLGFVFFIGSFVLFIAVVFAYGKVEWGGILQQIIGNVPKF